MHLVTATKLIPLARLGVQRSCDTGRHRRTHVIVRADDEEMIPLVRLPRTRHFTDTEQARLGKPSVQLGGKTIGEELSLIRKQYLEAEARAARSEEHLHDTNWQGDVYVGSRWNELSVLYLIFLLTPLVGLLCAWLSYGVYWGITPGLYGAPF